MPLLELVTLPLWSMLVLLLVTLGPFEVALLELVLFELVLSEEVGVVAPPQAPFITTPVSDRPSSMAPAVR